MKTKTNERLEVVVKELLKNSDKRYRNVLEFDVNHPRKACDETDYISDEDTITVCHMIANDGFDITGFKLEQIPAPKVYGFYNPKTRQMFDVACQLSKENPQWSFAYVNNYGDDPKCNYFPADTIQEAIEKWAY